VPLSSGYACSMSVFGRITGSRTSRIVWGIVALLLAVGLLVSMVMAGRALTDEKRAAEQRAGFLTSTVLFNALTPEVVSNVIFGPEYRSLIITVQGKILADSEIGPDAIAQVRIWRPDGTLIFSTAQRDKIGEFVAKGNPQIEQALGGQTVSLLTDAQVAPKAGLQGSEERLYETFVPLHLPSQIGVLAAVQIDTRYAAIAAGANRVWRPVEIGLIAGLVLALMLFAASFRRSRPAVATFGLTEGMPVADLAEADRRVRLAEKAAMQYQEKLATSEQQLNDALSASRRLEDDAKDTTARIASLEAEVDGLRKQAAKPIGKSKAEIEVGRLTAALKESELERERGMQEVRRMLGSVTALEADLAQARASVASGGAESVKTAERIRVAEERAAALEGEIAKTNEQLSQTEAARATLEAEAKNADEARKSKDAKDKKAGGELTKTKLELQVTTAKLAEVQQLAQTSQNEHSRAIAELVEVQQLAQTSQNDLGRSTAELEKVRASLAEREKALAEREEAFAKTQETLGQRDAELDDLRGVLVAKDAEVAQAKEEGDAGAKEAKGQFTVAETRAAAAETRAAAAETRAAAAEAKVAELEASTAKLSELEPRAGQVPELEGRVRELEDARRKEIVELQTAHERLANSQAELIATAKRAKEAEAELKRVVSAAAAIPAPVPAREPETYEEPTYEPATTLAGRLSRLAHRPDEESPAEEPTEEPTEEPADEPAAASAEEPSTEAESLRTRLTRAAAARHRLSTPPGGSSG
jgi:hypothetical protein